MFQSYGQGYSRLRLRLYVHFLVYSNSKGLFIWSLFVHFRVDRGSYVSVSGHRRSLSAADWCGYAGVYRTWHTHEVWIRYCTSPSRVPFHCSVQFEFRHALPKIKMNQDYSLFILNLQQNWWGKADILCLKSGPLAKVLINFFQKAIFSKELVYLIFTNLETYNYQCSYRPVSASRSLKNIENSIKSRLFGTIAVLGKGVQPDQDSNLRPPRFRPKTTDLLIAILATLAAL